MPPQVERIVFCCYDDDMHAMYRELLPFYFPVAGKLSDAADHVVPWAFRTVKPVSHADMTF